MELALHAVATSQQDTGWRVGYDATMQHLSLLKRKEEHLHRARINAEEQLLHAYEMEGRLLKEHKPYLNKKRGC